MPIQIYDRVQETTTSSGTNRIKLNGAVAGFRTFIETVGDSQITYYGIVDTVTNAWEIGIGQINQEVNGVYLDRTYGLETFIKSSNNNSPINLVGNSCRVFIDVPAEYKATIDNITKSMVGLGNVNNTSDLNKPISTAQQSALDLKANIANPTFTGTVTLPSETVGVTKSAGNSTTALATTEFVTTADNLKANIANPTFTGTVTLPTGTVINPTTLSFSQSVPFTKNFSYMNSIHAVDSDIVFTPNATNKIPGAVTLFRLLANGVNTVTFSGIKKIVNSADYDNREDILNVFVFFYDGTNYWVNIFQEENAEAIDGIAPTLQSAVIADNLRNKITLTYDETLNDGSIPDVSDFTTSSGTLTTVEISDTTVVLTYVSSFSYNESITLNYTAGDNPIQDTSNNNAANLSSQAVTNNISAPDLTAPLLSTATVENATPTIIRLTYDEALNSGVVPATTDFTVSGGKTVTNVGISGTLVTVTVNNAYEYGDTITISYTAGSNKIQDASGNFAANLSSQSVTNNIAGASFQIVSWENLVTSTDSGGFLNYGGSLPSGGRGTIAIDTTVAFEVKAQFTSLCPATVLFLDKDSTNAYAWGASQVFEAGTYHVSGTHYWAVNGTVPNNLGAVSLPFYAKFTKSGSDIILSTCATENGTYTTVKTFTNAITTSTLYIHVLFASNNNGDRIQVKYLN